MFDLLKMENPLRGFGAIFYKEVLHMRRDSFAILFALIVPILEMIILGYAIDTNVRQVKTAVYDQSGIMESGGAGSQESRTLLDRFRNSDTFRIYKYVHSDDELTREMVAGRARVGDGGHRVRAGRTRWHVQLPPGGDGRRECHVAGARHRTRGPLRAAVQPGRSADGRAAGSRPGSWRRDARRRRRARLPDLLHP